MKPDPAQEPPQKQVLILVAAAVEPEARLDVADALEARAWVCHALEEAGWTAETWDITPNLLASTERVFGHLEKTGAACVFNLFEGFGTDSGAEHRFRALLEQAGWLAGAPRANAEGRPLSVNYLTLNDNINLAVAQSVKDSLTECGFQVNIIAVDPQVYWNPEDDKSIFQGNFDLAQLNWPLPLENPCPLFSGTIGVADSLNFSGYDNAQLNALCAQWETTPLSSEKGDLVDQMEKLLNEDLALLPLYIYSDLRVARVDFCPVQADDRNDMAGIESFNYGGKCAP